MFRRANHHLDANNSRSSKIRPRKQRLARALTSTIERLEDRIVLASTDPVIAEFMAANVNTLRDQDGDSSDWVELFNPSDQTLNLGGWGLTDDAKKPFKWTFPNLELQPSQFLVVFASGKNIAVGSQLHTNFKLSADGEYLGLTRPDGTVADRYTPSFPGQRGDISYGRSFETTTLVGAGAAASILVPSGPALGNSWTQPGFVPDGSWLSGTTGVGYGLRQPGFSVHYVKANRTVDDLSIAYDVLDSPELQAQTADTTAPVINYLNTGPSGNFGDDSPYPTQSFGEDFEDFVLEAKGAVSIPEAGLWTFGVNSDDGFELVLERNGVELRTSYPSPRGPEATLATFDVPEAGEWTARLVAYERGGWSSVEMFAAAGAHDAFNGEFRLVGDTAAGGLAVTTLPPDSVVLGTDLSSQMLGLRTSAYLRIPFSVDDPTAFETLTLRMRYDDGFVAYLNGTEVARRNTPANQTWNSTASTDRPAGAGFVPEQIGLTNRLNLLQTGENLLTIQVLNVSQDDSDLFLMPELIGSRIDRNIGVYFTTPTPDDFNGRSYLGLVSDVSFSAERGFFDSPFQVELSSPTPNARIYYTTDGSEPTTSLGLAYTGAITVAQTSVIRAAAFLDGYVPSRSTTNTYLNLTDILHQASDRQAPEGWPTGWGNHTVDYGMDPDIVNDPRFGGQSLRDALAAIPTISVSTDLENLFDPSTGIYANPYGKGRAWERPASVELIDPSHATDGFQINAGLRIRGGYSRSTDNPKHAFRLFFRGEYGGTLNFPLFGDEGASDFEKVDLRTDQNYSWSFGGDGNHTAIRDVFSRDTQRDMGEAYTRSRYYHLYIDGQYWGMYQTQERASAEYAASYFGGEADDYDVVKVENYAYEIYATDGNLDAWQRLYNQTVAGLGSNEAYYRAQGKNPDGSDNPNYEALLDVDNLIDYMQVILFTGNFDAPISAFLGNEAVNNFYAIRNRTGREGFRFFAHDSEHSLFSTDEDRNGPFPAGQEFRHFNPQWLHQQLMANEEYRLRFADHVQKNFFNGGALTTAQSVARFQTRAAQIQQAILGESARWGDSKRPDSPLTRDDWQIAINYVINDYLPVRPAVVLDQFRTRGLFPSLIAPEFRVNGQPFHGGNVNSGSSLRMGTSSRVYYTLDGTDPRLPGGGLSASAIALDPLSSPDVILNASASVIARSFDGVQWSPLDSVNVEINEPATAANLVVTELHYNPGVPDPLQNEIDPDKDNYEFIELRNVGTREIDLGGVRFTAGVSFAFDSGTIHTLAAGQYVLVVKNLSAFQSRYGSLARVAGSYGTTNLSNGGERVLLLDASGGTIADFTYDDEGTWPRSPDGAGPSLVPIDPRGDLSDGLNWRPSTEINGSPGRAANELPTLEVVSQTATNEDTSTSPITIRISDTETSDGGLRVLARSDNATLLPASGIALSGTGATRTLVLTPAANQAGTAVLSITVDDGQGGLTTRTLILTVRPVNDAPSSQDDEYSTLEDSPITQGLPGVLSNDFDLEGDPLTVTLLAHPMHGTLVLNPNGSFTYAPDAEFSGTDQFRYSVVDPAGAFATAMVTIHVIEVPDPPQFESIGPVTIDEGSPLFLPLKVNDIDTPQDGFVFSLIGEIPPGLRINSRSGILTWTPADGPSSHQILVQAAERAHPESKAWLTIPISVENVTPTIDRLSMSPAPGQTLIAGRTLTGAVTIRDPGDDAWTVTASYGDGSPTTALSRNPDGTFALDHRYTTPGNFIVLVRVTDSDGDSSEQTQGVAVVPGPDEIPPHVVTLTTASQRGGSTRIDLAFSEKLYEALATNPQSFRLISAGRDGRLGTLDDQVIRLRTPRLDHTGKTIELRTLQRLQRNQTYQLWVAGSSSRLALRDMAGNRLDGNGDGLGGDDYVGRFRPMFAGMRTARRISR